MDMRFKFKIYSLVAIATFGLFLSLAHAQDVTFRLSIYGESVIGGFSVHSSNGFSTPNMGGQGSIYANYGYNGVGNAYRNTLRLGLTPKMWAFSQKLTRSMKEYERGLDRASIAVKEYQRVKKYFDQTIGSLSGQFPKFIHPKFIPTPIPEGVSADIVRDDLAPLWVSVSTKKINPFDVAKNIKKLKRLIKTLSHPLLSESDKKRGRYLEDELRRNFVNPSGLLKELPGAPSKDIRWYSNPRMPKGSDLRNRYNLILASQSVVSVNCATTGGITEKGCSSVGKHYFDLGFGYSLADRLAAGGQNEAFDALMTALQIPSNVLIGFGEGLIDGSVDFVKGIRDTIKVLDDLPAVAHGIKDAIVHYRATWKKISAFAKNKYEEILDVNPRKLGKIAGTLSVEVAASILGMSAASKVSKLLKGSMIVRSAIKGATLRAGKYWKIGQVLKGSLAHGKKAVHRVIDSSRQLGLKSGRSFKEFITTPLGKAWTKARISGRASLGEGGYKLLDTKISVSNPFPKNGVFAHATKRKYAEKFKTGKGRLGRLNPNEAWITAADDLKGYGRSQIAERLSLFKDAKGTIAKNVDDYVVVEFKLKNSKRISSPIDLSGDSRKYGWIPGGKTTGGAREWIIDPDALKKGMIDRSSIVIRELEN